jgi:hypothetical protein
MLAFSRDTLSTSKFMKGKSRHMRSSNALPLSKRGRKIRQLEEHQQPKRLHHRLVD